MTQRDEFEKKLDEFERAAVARAACLSDDCPMHIDRLKDARLALLAYNASARGSAQWVADDTLRELAARHDRLLEHASVQELRCLVDDVRTLSAAPSQSNWEDPT